MWVVHHGKVSFWPQDTVIRELNISIYILRSDWLFFNVNRKGVIAQDPQLKYCNSHPETDFRQIYLFHNHASFSLCMFIWLQFRHLSYIWEKILCHILCHTPLTKFTVTCFCDSWTWPCLGAFGSAVEVQTGVKGIPAESGKSWSCSRCFWEANCTNISLEEAHNTCHEVASSSDFSSLDTFITYPVSTGSLTTRL